MTEPMTEANFVECTTGARNKRHLKSPDYRGVVSCCGHSAYTQAEVEMWGRSVVIADLPPCKQCAKSKQRRIDGRKS